MFDSETRNEILRNWAHNVKDEFKPLTNQEIRDILKATCYKAAAAFENWMGDFNLSSGFRNANGFNLQELFYIGKKQWDRRGAVGCHNYMDISHYRTFSDFKDAVSDRYVLIGVDNIEGSIPVTDFEWPENSLMIFGEEGLGLTKEAVASCEHVVHIPMYGSVRSFNCSTSSGIIMYDYITKMNRGK